MRVTVLADASFCPEWKVAGYGFWIVCERGKWGGGGSMKGTVPSSGIAEMMAVVNALHSGLKVGLLMKGDEVLMQTDCVGAITTLQRPARSRGVTLPVADRVVWDAYTRLIEEHQIRVVFKHVKGHTGLQEPRYIANKMCDKRAKRGMRSARAAAKIAADA